jgi:CTD kinase subunit beta
MLEASGFDFRCRHPQRLLVKLAKDFNLNRKTVAKTAYDISIDVYRTFIPLKQSCSTMAFACLELAARIHSVEPKQMFHDHTIDYRRWFTSREEVIGKQVPSFSFNYHFFLAYLRTVLFSSSVFLRLSVRSSVYCLSFLFYV